MNLQDIRLRREERKLVIKAVETRKKNPQNPLDGVEEALETAGKFKKSWIGKGFPPRGMVEAFENPVTRRALLGQCRPRPRL